ncbi:thermonuclease family protein [Fulvimarina endophytica]|uniref:Thermonuclease family protein n=1 Tax=Fulvimarina endophytica TaxID=2293836 RepID=A0A371WYJ0_9HYPH|nr:thermonuclease family protein [Fulvimarina endophytica]
MKRIALSLGLTLGLGASGALAQTLSGPARVIDGDTIAIEGVENNIRLNFIDAPEFGQSCQNARGSAYDCGIVATDVLKKMIPEASVVTCEANGRDGYDRFLAVCKVGETDINGSMVASGWALEFVRYSDGRYGGYEADARAAGRGLWQGSFDKPWEWRDSRRQARFEAERDEALLASECAIKGNISRNGRIYHLPGQMDYDRVRIDESRGERLFCNEQEAKDAGWRRALR